MKRVLIPFAVALLGLLLPAGAFAKGASEAEITGPGLDKPISLAGEGQSGGEQLMQLAETAGFFPAVFVRSPDPMLDERPAGDLGPKYTITYVMPGPNNELDRLVQAVYPYAEPDPVTYTAPGQRFFGAEETRGGWFVATSLMKDQLVEAGLPQNPPAAGDGDGFPWAIVGGLAALAAALVVGALGAYMIRRRPGTATAA
jgi:hypothetical protein